MPHRVQSNEQGDILIPHDALQGGRPNGSYDIVQEGNTFRVIPADEESPTLDVRLLQEKARRYRAETSPEQRAKDFLEWVRDLEPKAPHLPDEALRRESFYD